MKEKRNIFYILSILCLFLVVNQNVFAATQATATKRLAGQDRYETAVAVSQDGWTKSEYLVIASGENFPDAICSTPLARAYDAPILLTNKNALTNGVWNEINRMGVKNVFLIGGIGVISSTIEADLKAKGIAVTRFGGKDRYETAVKVAQAIEKTGSVEKVVLVQGKDYAGAVAIASIAGTNKMPIILSDKDSMDPIVSQYFKGRSISKSYIVGGSELLSSNVEKAATNAVRLQGKDKYEVNLAILKEFANEYKYDNIYITTGENYPDALAASASAVKTSAPVLLANNILLKGIEDFINEKNIATNQIKLIGGEAVLPAAVALNIIRKEESPQNPDPTTDDGNKEFTICLDPGDGISKQEIVGAGGLKEKDVNLAVALKAGKLLEEKGIKVVYTRKTDSVPWSAENDLTSRFKISDEAKADFFLSIHCNSLQDSTKKGIETYYLDGVTAGKNLATGIQSKIIELLGTSAVNRGVKIGSYPELKGTVAPGVKVYLGFITNAEEEINLGNEGYQSKCAEAIAQAVINYKDAKSGSTATRTVTPEDVMLTVSEGEPCALPATVNIIQKDSTRKQVSVTWANRTVDTSKAGVYIVQGTVPDISSKVYLVITVIAKNSNNAYTVTLDAGHGGYDTGAIGPTGIREKDVTLPVVLKTADLLAKNGVKIVYTRVSDNVLWPADEVADLRMRCAISDKAKVNLYLSVHANSFSNPSASGTETYYSDGSEKGRTFAESIQKELLAATGLVDRKVKIAGYYVIENTDAPSALAELAFISNTQEEQLLASNDFTTKCANALSKAILSNLGQ